MFACSLEGHLPLAASNPSVALFDRLDADEPQGLKLFDCRLERSADLDGVVVPAEPQPLAGERPEVEDQPRVLRRIEVFVEVAVEPLRLRSERADRFVVESLQIPR